ncbi:MAG: ornithine carbamoyltransferase [Candidatus Poseidoniia archaeon]|nr:ornithine carbamoyltransferase [Candidatus Poseidoniia archaeon]
MVRHFLHISDFEADDLREILQLATELKVKFRARDEYRPFTDRSLVMIFAKPSARTRVSFETGFTWMGGHALFLGPNDIGIGKREAIKDIARLFSRYNYLIMARLFDHAHILELAEHATIPVINGLTDYNHPCQIMADIFTIQEHLPGQEKVKVVYLGDGNNVVHSWLRLAMRLPLHFSCCCPQGYEPDADTVAEARGAGISTIEVLHDPQTAVADADVIYTDVWASMGQKDEADAREKVFAPYQVNKELMAATGRETLFMHCLPAERGREVTDAVMEADYSIVFDQAENRMHVQNAIMAWLVEHGN